MDKKYLENSTTFSLFSKEELENQEYIHEINILAEKYNILENENQLINSTDKNFLYLINFIVKLDEQNLSIPQDIENLFFENLFLKDQVNTFLKKKLDDTTKNSSLYFFKEINQIFLILCLGVKEKILNLDFDYDFSSISKSFRFYESLLKHLFETNIKLFYLTFDSYTILLKTFIQLSKINSIDIIKAKQISAIFELITETLSIIRFNISLDEKQLRKLSSIQGKYLFYFSHLDQIDLDKTNINKSIEKYFLCFEKQIIGYTLYQNNISLRDDIHSDEFLVHKNLSSILLLTLLDKLNNSLRQEEYKNTDFFQKILRLYYKRFIHDKSDIKNENIIELFKKHLLNSLFYNYTISFDFIKIIGYHSVIEDFIISEKSFNNKNLETIYNLLRFTNDIEDFKYFNIAEILTESKPIENEYDEFYKLCIFDLIINKPLEEKYFNQKLIIYNKISIYLNSNQISQQLKSIYNKLDEDLSKFNLSSKNLESKKKDSNEEIQKIILNYTSDDDEYEINY